MTTLASQTEGWLQIGPVVVPISKRKLPHLWTLEGAIARSWKTFPSSCVLFFSFFVGFWYSGCPAGWEKNGHGLTYFKDPQHNTPSETKSQESLRTSMFLCFPLKPCGKNGPDVHCDILVSPPFSTFVISRPCHSLTKAAKVEISCSADFFSQRFDCLDC